MENASKALLIAGSVLFTIIVIGLLAYFYGQYRQFPEQQAEAQRLAQVTKFNREYESYDKKKMYGTDVATIINKAISNNSKYANSRTGEYDVNEFNNYINVVIVLKEDIVSYSEEYVEQPDTGGMIDVIRNDKGTLTIDGQTFKFGTVLTADQDNVLYTVTYDKNKNPKSIKANDTMIKFFNSKEKIKIQSESGKKTEYTLVYSGFTEFKRKIFACTGFHYNEATSKIDCIYFEETSLADGEEIE